MGEPTRCVVGIDGGGTKTICVVAAEDGRELGRATGGPSNYQTVGTDAVRIVFAQVVQEAAQAAGAPLDVTGVCLALAGVDRTADRQAIAGVVRDLLAVPLGGVRWALSADQAVITNDAVAALVGGTGRKQGVVVVAGTGSIAFGVNGEGEQRRAGGWGSILGDEGSGYAIGAAGLRAVCRAADGRGPATSLQDTVLRSYSLGQPSDLVGLTYGVWRVADIAAVARLVLEAAEHGDAVARDIVEEAAGELALDARAVIDGLGMTGERFDLVMAGSVWGGSAELRRRFAAAVREWAPGAQVIASKGDPIQGAVLLAREAVGAATLE